MPLALPNGGKLINREAKGEAAMELSLRAREMVHLALDAVQAADLLLIATGALSPLTGFMNREEFTSVVECMRLPSGHVLGLPIFLAVDSSVSWELSIGQEVALFRQGKMLAVMTIEDIFTHNKEATVQAVFGTADTAHPGVAYVLAQSEVLIGGPVTMINRPSLPFLDLAMDPAEVRARAAALGWQTMVGFQTRNPIHRAHEYIQKCAMEIVDGLLLHPLMGETKADDVPAAVRLDSYRKILDLYYPADRVILSAFPAAMRYAGPREAVFHAICRRNYGCTHFIVGRDHAGVGSFYGTYDAQRIFSVFTTEELGIQPLFFEHSFYCRICGQMATAKTCPHNSDAHISLSGTKVRSLLSQRLAPPPELTRPEVAAVLLDQ